MNVPIPLRWRKAIALGLVTLPAPAFAADPAPFPIQPARTARDIEIIHGTTKVWPIFRPVPVPVMPAEAKGWSGAPIQPPAPITPPAPKEEPKQTPAPVIESRTIILAGYAGPYTPQQPSLYPQNSPWLAAPQAMPMPMPVPQHIPAVPQQQQQTQPTVVVIREPNGEPRPILAAPAPAEPRGVTIGNEMLLGIGIGVAGLGFGFAGWRRRTAATGTKAGSPLPFSPLAGDGMLLMGKYNAGPCPTSAEKFDLGPSYQMQQQEKKKTEEQNQQAVLEFILNQNLALHAELGGTTDNLPEATELNPEDN